MKKKKKIILIISAVVFVIAITFIGVAVVKNVENGNDSEIQINGGEMIEQGAESGQETFGYGDLWYPSSGKLKPVVSSWGLSISGGVSLSADFWVDGTASVSDDLYIGGISLDATGSAVAGSTLIGIPALSGATYTTQEHFNRLAQSAGRVSGGGITDNGDGTATVAAGTGFIKATDSDVVELLSFDWVASSSVAIVDDDITYIGIDYNAGSPKITAEITITYNYDTAFPLGSIIDVGTHVDVVANPWWVGDSITNVIERTQSFGWITRDEIIGGFIISESGTRNLDYSGGTLWSRLNEVEVAASTAAQFEAYYRDGGGNWTIDELTQWSVEDYDTGTGLASLSANKYANIWVYMEWDKEPAIVYPQNQYTVLAQAEAEELPSTLPEALTQGGLLLGRILIKEGTDAAVQVQSAFVTTFTAAQAADHANLANLAWTSSKHTGTANTFAGFDGAGAATEYTESNYILADGTRALTGDWSMGLFNITGGDYASFNSASLSEGLEVSGTASISVLTLDTDLGVAHGGTGLSIIGASELLYGSSADVFGAIASPTEGYVLTGVDGKPDWAAAGAGDVTGVGDCADGACLDGTSDGGTYITFYNIDSNKTQLIASDIASDLVITLPVASMTMKDWEINSGTIHTDNYIENPFGADIGVAELTSEDFGDFTCDGSTCDLDATYLTTIGDLGLDALGDVATSSVAEDEILAFNNTSNDWENQTAAELSLLTTSTGLLVGISLGEIANVATTSVADNEILSYEDSSSDWINQTPTELGLIYSGGTLTDTQLCVADGTSGAIDCNVANTVHAAVTITGQNYLTLSTQQITMGEIEPDDLAASDFGFFTCDGDTCSVDTEVLIIGTDVKAGTLTDTKYCIWDDGNSQVVCDSEGGAGTVSSNSLDFDELVDAMILDAETSISFGNYDYIFNLTGTGNFNIQDDGTSAFFVASTSHIGIGTSDPSQKLTVQNGNITLLLGADVFDVGLTDATQKAGMIGMPHYTNTEEPMNMIFGSSAASTNTLYWGGGTALMNAATTQRFYTAANNTTTTGTERFTIISSGNVGIGDSVPGFKLSVDGTASVSGAFYVMDNLFEASNTSVSFGGNLTIAAGSDFIIGAVTWSTTDDMIDGEQIYTDTIDNDSIDWGDMTDLTTDGAVSWGNITAGELADNSIIDADIDDDGSFAFTGAWDFSGASLELPNGANITLDADGEAGIDTTADQLQFYSGGEVHSIVATESFSFKISSDQMASSSWHIEKLFLEPATIVRISCRATTGTTWRMTPLECDGNAANCSNIDSTLSIGTTRVYDDGSLSNPTLDAGDTFVASTSEGAISGAVETGSCDVFFKWTGE